MAGWAVRAALDDGLFKRDAIYAYIEKTARDNAGDEDEGKHRNGGG